MTKMQLNSLLLFFTIGLFHIGSNTEIRPERSSEDLELLVESRMRNMELRLEEMELRNERLDTRNKQLEATITLLETQVQDLEHKESIVEQGKPEGGRENEMSLRDLPIILISAWRGGPVISPRTVTFQSFLVNFNNGDTPGGGDSLFDLDTGIFTCLTPGYYSVSFSALGIAGPTFADNNHSQLYLYKNGIKLVESHWVLGNDNGNDNEEMGVTSSRIVVSIIVTL